LVRAVVRTQRMLEARTSLGIAVGLVEGVGGVVAVVGEREMGEKECSGRVHVRCGLQEGMMHDKTFIARSPRFTYRL